MTIRVLTSILVALLMAVAVTVGGYAGLVTWRRAPVPTTPRAAAPTPAEPLPPVSGLAPIPPRALPAPASLAAPLPRATGAVTLEIHGRPLAPIGVALLDGDSGATLGWQQLTAEATSITFTGVPVGDHWWAIARELSSARFAYVSRGRVHVGEDGEAVGGTAVLDLARSDVLVQLAWPELETPEPPIVVPTLTRGDDPSWYFLPEKPFELVASQSLAFELRDLGPGTYTLALEGADVDPEGAAHLVFTVPGTTQIELRCHRP